MGRSNIRLGQLISTFGPGSLMVDRYGASLIICGLDYWYFQEPDAVNGTRIPAEKKSEFRFSEWRLEQSLDMDYFMEPPDFRIPIRKKDANEPNEQNPNLKLSIPSLRFPSFFVCSQVSCNALIQDDFHRGQRPRCTEHTGYSRMNQVRFVSICPNGHINDFPWKRLLGCDDSCPGTLRLREQGSSDLASISVACSCGRSENLAGTTSYDRMEDGSIKSVLSERIRKNTGSEEAGCCSGRRLWHGPDSYESCDQDVFATFPNATNVYYSNSKTSIFIPVQQDNSGTIDEIIKLIEADTNSIVVLKTMWGMQHEVAIDYLHGIIDKNPAGVTDISVAKQESENALTQFFSGIPVMQAGCNEPAEPESSETAFRRVEFNVLRQQANERDLRTTPVAVPPSLTNFLEMVMQVERLKETRVIHGFDRFMAKPPGGFSPAELGAQALHQLFATPPDKGNRWLPGKVVYGEGIYIELSNEYLRSWQKEQHKWIERRLIGEHNFGLRFSQLDIDLAPVTGGISNDWISRYLLVHTFAHIIINQLIFECGYSTASLTERLFVSDDPAAPMAAMLIYTSAGDSEGTLGGLVRLAQPELFAGVIKRACQRASWCSADPVCSEVTNSTDQNLAACHSCVLLPETSCETFNRGLDRAMAIGTPSEPDVGYFSKLLQTVDRQTIN